MTELVKQLVTPTPLAVVLAWYLLSGVLSYVIARRTQIDAWCAANPKLAFALNLLRAIGLDPLKITQAAKTYADSKAEFPPIFATSKTVELVGSAVVEQVTTTKTTVVPQ